MVTRKTRGILNARLLETHVCSIATYSCCWTRRDYVTPKAEPIKKILTCTLFHFFFLAGAK